MKGIWRRTRILILSLLAFSVFLPIFLPSDRLKDFTSDASKVFIEDLSSIKHRLDVLKDEGRGLKEPELVVYKDGSFDSSVIHSSSDENSKSEQSGNDNGISTISVINGTNQSVKTDSQENQQDKLSPASEGKHKQSRTITVQQDWGVQSKPQRAKDEKLKEMKDQVIRARTYLSLASPNSNSQLVRELKLRIKEVERAVGKSTKDSDLSKSALQRMRSMKASLLKASRIYKHCSIIYTKLCSMIYDAEEHVRTQTNQAKFLVQLAGRSTPKALHCLSMLLTVEYFALLPKERELPNQHRAHDPHFYHFALFSDNVLACAVVVNSTISSAMDPGRVVFHIVTNSLYLPAISMWFLLNPPGRAAVQVENIETFESLSAKYGGTMHKRKSLDPRYISALNHLRFYLPDVYPMLNKILLLDHDVVVQRDLTRLWNVNMKGKVNGAVETCQKNEPLFRQMDMFVNFSDPMVSRTFNANACTWAFGMNMFDLQEWRRQNLTELYHKYLQLGNKRPLWKAGSLPLGWVTFYNRTVALDRRWHVLGLGYDSSVRWGDIKQAAVIHYDGIMKPWLDIGIQKYKDFWRKYVNYEHSLLQQCNIHR